MLLDLNVEKPISLKEASRILPPGRSGRPVGVACLLRWVLHGAKKPTGGRAYLEALRVGSRWLTSRAAIQRFGEALTPRPIAEQGADAANEAEAGGDAPHILSAHTTTATRSPKRRQQTTDQIDRELERFGV